MFGSGWGCFKVRGVIGQGDRFFFLSPWFDTGLGKRKNNPKRIRIVEKGIPILPSGLFRIAKRLVQRPETQALWKSGGSLWKDGSLREAGRGGWNAHFCATCTNRFYDRVEYVQLRENRWKSVFPEDWRSRVPFKGLSRSPSESDCVVCVRQSQKQRAGHKRRYAESRAGHRSEWFPYCRLWLGERSSVWFLRRLFGILGWA